MLPRQLVVYIAHPDTSYVQSACGLQTKTAVDTLQAKNSKLEYQILHLKRAVKDADAAKASQAVS